MSECFRCLVLIPKNVLGVQPIHLWLSPTKGSLELHVPMGKQ